LSKTDEQSLILDLSFEFIEILLKMVPKFHSCLGRGFIQVRQNAPPPRSGKVTQY
jgi:hypothetical protein